MSAGVYFPSRFSHAGQVNGSGEKTMSSILFSSLEASKGLFAHSHKKQDFSETKRDVYVTVIYQRMTS